MSAQSAAGGASPGGLRHLAPGWFAAVMGWSGLALAWWRGVPAMGDAALGAALACAVIAFAGFLVLAAASILRAWRHPAALLEDARHPVRHVFFAAIPISVILLATVLTAVAGPTLLGQALWMAGSAVQFGVTVWVVARWLRPKPHGLAWPAITPALLIPVVGNVVPALAGPELGYPAWAAAQFGVGLVFWPVLLVLFIVRLGLEGPWPQRLLPTTFVTVAPPAVIGLGLLQFGAPIAFAFAAWGVALFFLAWSATVVRPMREQAFGIPFWALSFPLAAFSALSLRLAPVGGPVLQLVATVALALTSLVVLSLSWSTVQGLRHGSLLVPEPVPGQPVPTPG